MDIVFLSASIPLTKTYAKKADGSIEKTNYPNVANFTSHHEQCSDMKAFEALLKKHAAKGHTLLKGTIAKPLHTESRKGSTDSNGHTEYIVFDLDGIPNLATVEQVLTALGFSDISYVVQYSASYKIENNDLRAHVFMQLAKPMAAPLLKQWLIHLNHTVDLLRNAMKLTKTANSISWPLDITACQNDKLIYIAPPMLKGIKDPLGAKQPRIAYVQKKLNKLDITSSIPTTEINRTKTDKRINELRVVAGLPERKFTLKMVGSNQVMVKPDNATVSEYKIDRGFVYFNLNGGDSWAYYHPENNPDFIFNFKGEPTYLTKELLPEYWEEITQAETKANSDGVIYLTFLDRRTSGYYRGTYDQKADRLEIFAAKNETQVRHFAKQHGVPLGDFIPEWDLVFEPLSKYRVDVSARKINAYEPTKYGKKKPRKITGVPPTIARTILHALGNDLPSYDHFLNWLACVFQYRTRTLTAWILHGVEGTGKGAMMHLIIKPLLGDNQVAIREMGELNDRYNHWLQNKFVVFIDELEARALENEKGAAARLRNWITEPTIAIRAMITGSYDVENNASFIMSSNKPEPVVLSRNDRRHNVAAFQPVKLILLEKDIKAIESELQDFHDYLMTRTADRALAQTVLQTADRDAMISISETSIDIAISNTLNGNMEFFVDQMPSNDAYKKNALSMNKVEDYREALLAIIDRTDAKGGCNISRDELRVIFDYTVGNMPTTPNKFTSMLKHHRIHMTKVWIDSKAVQGIKVTWSDVKDIAKHRDTLAPPVKAAPKLKSVGGTKK